MSDDAADFERLQHAGAAVIAGVDQATSIFRPTMEALAGFERACLAAGMSERSAAAYTMKLADGFGWPPMGVSS